MEEGEERAGEERPLPPPSSSERIEDIDGGVGNTAYCSVGC